MSNLLILLLIGHLLGDYYLQNEQIAVGKQTDFGHLLLHGFIYTIAVLFLLLPSGRVEIWFYGAIASGLHVLIDLIKFGVTRIEGSDGHGTVIRKLRKWDRVGAIYVADQILHLSSLTGLVWLFDMSYQTFNQWVLPFGTWNVDRQILQIVLAVLAVLKPVNITFRKLYQQNRPVEGEISFVKDMKAGQKIGNLERLLVLAFIMLQQYTAIGLVFTAKSVTRYYRISEEPAFAEYYLLGTLFSILATLTVYIGVFRL